MKSWWCAAALLVLAGGVVAQGTSRGSTPTRSTSTQSMPMEGDAPQPDKTVRDAEFGVVARHFGLQREVQMYQWRATGARYTKVWSARPIDSSGFQPGYANPPFPLHGRQWLARSISIDDKPLAPEVIASLGQWRDFRPGFSALPGNLAATFQPEGDGLGSAENPLDPQIGDLRIRWRELVLPPLQDRIVLRDGRWRLLAPAAVAVDALVSPPQPSGFRRAYWWLLGGAVTALAAALAVRRRRRDSPGQQEQ